MFGSVILRFELEKHGTIDLLLLIKKHLVVSKPLKRKDDGVGGKKEAERVLGEGVRSVRNGEGVVATGMGR